MASISNSHSFWTLCSLLLWPITCLTHMEMDWPYALRSKHNPDNDYSNIDYSMTSPLSADGTNFPCKGYQNDRPFQSVTTYTAGSTYNISLAGSATHLGGSCQIALSYDNGATFRVVKSIIGGCPLSSSYDFKIPSFAPSGYALLSWTWQNHAGNREFYQNCAQVKVIPSASRRLRRQNFHSFNSLPFIWKANLEGINDCATAEGSDPVYPNPGPDVVYAGDVTASSPVSPGTCDWPTPYGLTYKNRGDSTLSPGAPDITTDDVDSQMIDAIRYSAPQSEEVKLSALYSPIRKASTSTSQNDETTTGIQGRSASITAIPTASNFDVLHNAIFVSTRSTITVTADCPATFTVPATLSTLTTTRKSPSSASPTVLSQTTAVPFATGDINARYLPCVPGSYLCTSSTTFVTCNYNDDTIPSSDETWVYAARDQRSVAAGMECLPMLSPYSSGSKTEYGQQDNTLLVGEYRDDRVVRARPEGGCDVDGSLRCTYEGGQFSVCDHGGWVPMGAVPVGTQCQNGNIVSTT